MSKNTRIVGITFTALVIVVSVLAWMNRLRVGDVDGLQEDSFFYVVAGESEHIVGIGDLEAVGLRDVDANYKTNLKPAVQKRYTGASLRSVLDSLGVDYSEARRVSFSATDGYVSAAPIADALNEESCFIVIAEAGKPLGNRASGGVGPFMVIFAKERYSQRWCKLLYEITVS